jgi:hypothetical protein
MVLDRVGEEMGGNVYRWPERDMERWLCPALLEYFEIPPQERDLDPGRPDHRNVTLRSRRRWTGTAAS